MNDGKCERTKCPPEATLERDNNGQNYCFYECDEKLDTKELDRNTGMFVCRPKCPPKMHYEFTSDKGLTCVENLKCGELGQNILGMDMCELCEYQEVKGETTKRLYCKECKESDLMTTYRQRG